MSENKKPAATKAPAVPNVVSLPSKCNATGCTAKPSRVSFCKEHFAWFKEGLITRAGEKARDFDKKHQDFVMRTKKAS